MAEAKKTQSEELVQIPKEQHDFLINQLKTLSKRVGDIEGGVVEIERTTEHTCNLRLWEDKYVLSFTSSWDERDPATKERKPMIGITVEGGKERIDVPLVDFYRYSVLSTCKIKEKRLIDKGVKEYGTVEIKEVNDYSTKSTGVRVKQKVETPVYELLLETPDGREITINEEFVN